MPIYESLYMKKEQKEKTAEEKAAIAEKTWGKKTGKRKTLTGKPAAEIVIRPDTKRVDNRGKPIDEKPLKKKAFGESVAVIATGRMNPPTRGHEILVEKVAGIAEEVNGTPILFLSKTADKNNPLSFYERSDLVAEAFGDIVGVAVEPFGNLIELLKQIGEQFESVVWVTGSDQLDDYTRILETYNGKDFNFKYGVVVSGGQRDPDSDVLSESISATQLREAVKNNDLKTFTEGLPTRLKYKAELLFEQVGFGINLWGTRASTLSEEMLRQIALQRYKN